MGFCLRPDRYALAIAEGSVAAAVLGLHQCDNPVCVKIAADSDPQQHVVSGSEGDNIERMAWMCGGGGRHAARRCESRGVRRERSGGLREAVHHGWMPPRCRRRCLATSPTLRCISTLAEVDDSTGSSR